MFEQARESGAKVILSQKFCSFILIPREVYNFMDIFLHFIGKDIVEGTKNRKQKTKQKTIKLHRIEATVVDEISQAMYSKQLTVPCIAGCSPSILESTPPSYCGRA